MYTVPTLGGDVRLVAKDGRRPRFSPDGSLIAYWTGDEHIQGPADDRLNRGHEADDDPVMKVVLPGSPGGGVDSDDGD